MNVGYRDRVLPLALGADLLVDTAAWTILLSVMLHGISSVPLANWYGRWLDTANAAAPELVKVPQLGVRRWDPLGWLKHHQPGGEKVPMS